MILIITNALDEHADLVCTRLDHQREEYLRLHTETLLSDFTLTYTPGSWKLKQQQSNSYKNLPLEPIDLSRIRSVWFRRPKPVQLPNCSPEELKFAQREWQHFVKCLYQALMGRKWLNNPEQIDRAESKLGQLDAASSLGISIPKSIVTNDPTEAISFFDGISGDVIYKQMSGYFYLNRTEGRGYAIFTNIVRRQDLIDRADEIRLAPCLFQEYILKSKELRITIVDKTIFATEIDSQSSERSRVDWRHYDIENTPYRKVDIPATLAEKLLALLDIYSLSFGCIDMVLTPAGEYVFLELNPNGQWQWIEMLTGQPISERIAIFLSQRGDAQLNTHV